MSRRRHSIDRFRPAEQSARQECARAAHRKRRNRAKHCANYRVRAPRFYAVNGASFISSHPSATARNALMSMTLAENRLLAGVPPPHPFPASNSGADSFERGDGDKVGYSVNCTPQPDAVLIIASRFSAIKSTDILVRKLRRRLPVTAMLMQGATAGLRGRHMHRITQMVEDDYCRVERCNIRQSCHTTEEQADFSAWLSSSGINCLP